MIRNFWKLFIAFQLCFATTAFPQELGMPPGGIVSTNTEPSEFELTRNVDSIRATRDQLELQYGKRHPNVVLYTKQLQIAQQNLDRLRQRNEKVRVEASKTPPSNESLATSAVMLELQRTLLSLSDRVLELEKEVRALRKELDSKSQRVNTNNSQ